MGAGAVVARAPRARFPARGLFVVAACVAAAAAFAYLRRGIPFPFATFQGACERLRASGLPITDRDWFCEPVSVAAQAGAMAGIILAAIAVALPTAVLAATGRRVLAAVPLLAAPWVGSGRFFIVATGPWWDGASWPQGEVANAVVTFAILAAPAAAVAAVVPRRPRGEVDLSLSGGALATVVCALPVVPAHLLLAAALGRHYQALGWQSDATAWIASAFVIATFAAILGPDRRWWPWILAPVAILLSLGPSAAVLVGPEGLTDWGRFGAVLPLAVVGISFSAWMPLASWLSRRLAAFGGEHPDEDDDEGDDEDDARSTRRPVPSLVRPRVTERPRSGHVRPTVVLNAFAAGLLVASVIAFVGDPAPAVVRTPLPTYLGVRSAAEEARALMNLELGIDAMRTFHDGHGTYRGFTADVAVATEPALAWLDGPLGTGETGLGVQIVTARRDTARVATTSPGGGAFCLQRSGTTLTYGSADGAGSDRVLRAAVAACGSTPWSHDAISVPPYETMCAELDAQGGYLICRMVQALVARTLATSNPDV